MPRCLPLFAGILVCVVTLVEPATAFAAPTPEQKGRLLKLRLEVRKVKVLADRGRAREALVGYEAARKEIVDLWGDGADKEMLEQLGPIADQLRPVSAILELEGLTPEPLPAAGKPAGAPGDSTTPVGDMVSFSKQVAPLLAAKCGKCHVSQSKGKISMATFTALMQGSPTDGPIILPGQGPGSRIAEVIESGDMPRGGGKVSRDELALITRWIDQGAKNDGQANAALAAATPAGDKPEMAKIVQATGNESMHFGLDVATVLVEHCAGCHGGRRPRADFDVTTFQKLLTGGESGPAIVAGKPAMSLLIQKLKGSAGERMPLEKPPLPDATIAKFETWIAEGARFDGDNPSASMERIANVAVAKSSTPEELSQRRLELAAANWRLAVPDVDSRQVQTKTFLLYGDLSEGALAEIGEQAEIQAKAVLELLKLPADSSITKGRLTLFLFANRYDYSEFAHMVEKREVPRSWRGHWKFDVVGPYVAVTPPRTGEYSLDALLAQQLASVAVAARGDGAAPRWLSEGVGRYVASQIDAKDPRVASWEERLPEIFSRMSAADDFMTGKLSPDDSDTVSFSFVRHLMASSSRMNKLLAALDEGTPFEEALRAAYGADASTLAKGWARTAVRRRR
ncbi:MAG: hypothetical protein KDA42_00815 [Planctomycetales bacterium]|nr:hypothetical protein [Planctomycetales bacterium]